MVLHTMDAPNQEVTEMPTTLEAFHAEKMKTMNDKRGQVTTLEQKITDKEAQIDAFTGALHSDEYKVMVEELQDLEQQVVRLQKDDERLDYFLQVGNILFNYYDSQEKIASGHHVTSKKPASKLRTPQNSVLNYFSAGPAAAAAAAINDGVDAQHILSVPSLSQSLPSVTEKEVKRLSEPGI